MKRILSTLVALIVMAAFSIPSAGAAESPTIPPGSLLRVKLGTTITSKTNKPGDTFTGMVMQDVVSGDETVVPKGSLVDGHIAFLKPAGRIKAKAQMRIVLDSITTPEDQKIRLSSTLEDTRGGVCGSTANDEEGTIVGCGKSKKEAAKDVATGAAIGAGAGSAVGIGHEIDCRYYGNCGGTGMGGDILYGAAIGASTALIYNIFKHQKEIILIAGTELMFVVNRTAESSSSAPPPEASQQQASAPKGSDE
ncbi:MAG TPA: hypothetical protein VM182_07310 [Terriglobia bacterium]|nr:hypothetical protein [Terriglobia bacterium]